MTERRKRGSSSRATVTWKDSIASPTRKSGRNSESSPASLQSVTSQTRSGRRSGSLNKSVEGQEPLPAITSPPNCRSGGCSESLKKSSVSRECPPDVPSPQTRSGRRSGSLNKSAEGQECPPVITSPPTRRSAGRSGSLTKPAEMPIPVSVMKRPVTAKKIMPRKTLAALASAELQLKPTATANQLPAAVISAPQSTPKVSSVTSAPRRSSRTTPKSEKENAIASKSQDTPQDTTEQSVSKIDVLSPIPLNIPPSPSYDDRAKVMSQKVRRSYSRLEMSLNGSSFLYSPTKNKDSDTSTPNATPKGGRKTLFGFDKLISSDATEEESGRKKAGKENKKTANDSTNSTSMREAVEEPDTNIPGVAIVKQKRRKRKIPVIEKTELDEWAAAMNAEFEEAEKFDLTVE